MKKALSIILSLLLAITLMAGCGGSGKTTSTATPTPAAEEKPEGGSEELKPVKLTMYVLGDKTKDFDEVFAEINKLSENDLKCTVDTKFISWADFQTKYSLVFASGEKFDMIFTASWSYYAQQAVKNGFLELTDDLLKKYAPNCFAKIPKEAWDQARINGKVYMLPNTQNEFNHLGYLVRGDLREKYGLPEIKTIADWDKYVLTIAENEKGIIPYDGGSDFDAWTLSSAQFFQPNGLVSIITGYAIKLTDPKAEPIKLADMPEYIEYLKKMREFNQKGVWSKNALNNKIAIKDSYVNGKSATALHNLGTMTGAWKTTMTNHPEWKPEVFDSMENFPTLRTSYLGNGMAVHKTSENPERALMFIDKVRFDQTYYDLMMYGVEGKHWHKEGDKEMKSDPKGADYGGWSNWGFVTQESLRRGTDGWPQFYDVLDGWAKRDSKQAVAYMSFDDSNFKNQTAAMTNLSREYSKMLDYGFSKDPEKLLKEYEQKLDAAGRQKVLAEWIKQKDNYLQNYGK